MVQPHGRYYGDFEQENKYREAHVYSISSSVGLLAGRVCAIRLRTHREDVCLIGTYSPPMPQHVDDKHRQCVEVVSKFERNLMHKLPHRCIPAHCMDGIGHVGLIKHNLMGKVFCRSRALGNCQPEITNYNGAHIQQEYEREHMMLCNTFFCNAPTYYGTQGNGSRIDYIGLPQGAHNRLKWCKTWFRTGSLQLTQHLHPRDHDPLGIEFDARLQFEQMIRTVDSSELPTAVSWDRDELVSGVHRALGRAEFQTAVENACATEQWQYLLHDRTPDRFQNWFYTTVKNAAEPVYSSKANTTLQHHRDSAQRRRQLLLERRTAWENFMAQSGPQANEQILQEQSFLIGRPTQDSPNSQQKSKASKKQPTGHLMKTKPTNCRKLGERGTITASGWFHVKWQRSDSDPENVTTHNPFNTDRTDKIGWNT